MARKEKKYHFIYKTTNLLNGKYYYGMHSTDDLNDNYIGSGTRLWYSIQKYGKENHSMIILEYLPNRKELKKREKELVNESTIKDPMCMNIKIGGEGGLDGLSKESIAKIRKGASNFIFKLRENPDFVEKINKLSSDRMKEHHKNHKIKYGTFKGKSHSIKTINKMKLSHKGHGIGSNNSQFGTCWITKNNVNKKINKSELPKYISDGWNLGRVLK